MPNVSRNPQSGCFSTEDPVSQQETCSLYFLILSLQSTPLSSNRHLQDVFSFGRWWVGLYHVWSSGNTGVFCGVAQVSQCGSLSTRVRHFPFCVCPFSPSCFLQVIKKSIAPCSFFYHRRCDSFLINWCCTVRLGSSSGLCKMCFDSRRSQSLSAGGNFKDRVLGF